MKNVPSFVTGIIVTVLAVVLLFVTTSDVFLFKIMHMIAIWVNLIAGILLVIGGIWNNKDSSGTGFGIGVAAWALIITTSIFDITCNLSTIEIIPFFNFMLFADIISWGPYVDPFDKLMYLYWWTTFTDIYRTGFLSSIFRVAFGATCATLGSISFGMVMHQTK